MKTGFYILLAIFSGHLVYGQQLDTLCGHIFFHDGEVQMAAIASVNGTEQAALAQLDGSYRLAVPADDEVRLRFSDDGCLPLEIERGSATKIDVILMGYYFMGDLTNTIKWMKRYKRKHGTRFFFRGRLLDRYNQPLANSPIRMGYAEGKIMRTDAEGWFKIFAPARVRGVIITHSRTPAEEDGAASSVPLVIAKVIY